MPRTVRAFTLVELLVVITIIGILMAIILPSMTGAQKSAREARERKQLGDINTAWKSWAASHRNAYPIPGLVRRQAKDLDGDGNGDKFVLGAGRENAMHNHHAALLSLCIMENLVAADLLVSPNEYANGVYAYTDYNYDILGSQASSDGDTHRWDPNFSNDLVDNQIDSEGADFCHNSYAIMPLAGERRRDQWDRTGDSSFAILATRGPAGGCQELLSDPIGNCDYSDFDDQAFNGYLGGMMAQPSNTAYLMAQPGAWRGVVVYTDGHTEVLEGFYPEGTVYTRIEDDGSTRQLPDNIFRAQAEPANAFNADDDNLLGADIYLTHTDSGDRWMSESTHNPLDVQYEPLHD